MSLPRGRGRYAESTPLSEQKVTCRGGPEPQTEKKMTRNLVDHANKQAPRRADTSLHTARLTCPPRPCPRGLGVVPAAAATGRPLSPQRRRRPGGGLSTGSGGCRRLSLRSALLPQESESEAERRRFPPRRGRLIASSARQFRGSHGSSVLPLGRNPAQ